MDEPGFISNMRIAILGLGLMGGSLALALKGRCKELIGVDHDPDVLALALEKKAVDRAFTSAAEALSEADLLVLATPVRTILSLLGSLPEPPPQGLIVIDLGSTKTEIVAAMQALPERFDPIGGHPMCGKETSSLAAADAAIYLQAPFALTPLHRTSERAKAAALDLVNTIGARPIWLNPQTHDYWVAASSQLPYLLSNALSAVTPDDVAPLIGPGFVSTSRVGATSPDMMLDALLTNRQNALIALRGLRARIDQMENALNCEDGPKLTKLLKTGAQNRRRLLELAGRG